MWKPLILYLSFMLPLESAHPMTGRCLSALRANAQSEFECQAYPEEQFSFGTFLLVKRDPEFRTAQVPEVVTEMLDGSRRYLDRARGFESSPPEGRALVLEAQRILEFAFPQVVGMPFPLDLRKTVMILPETVMHADRIAMKAFIDQELIHRSPLEFLRAIVHENIHLAGRADETLLEYDALPLLESLTEWITLRCFDVAQAAGISVSRDAFKGSPKYRQWVNSLDAVLTLLTPGDPADLLKLLYVTGNAEPLRARLRGGLRMLPAEPRAPELAAYLNMLRAFAGAAKR